MARLSIFIGIGLMLVGAMGYALPEKSSVTALIPAFVGVIMAIGGLITLSNEKLRKHIMHLNALLAAMLMVSAAMRLPYSLVDLKQNFFTIVVLSDVVFLSGIFMFYAVKSFVEARIAKTTYSLPEEALKEGQKEEKTNV